MTSPHDSSAEDLSNAGPIGTEPAEHAEPFEPLPVADSAPPRSPVDSVLLIDGDNDPHVPPDAHVTRHTLVRVFLRPGAKLPRNLEKALGRLPHLATVVSPKGGANAADFVMSLHAGMLHAILPQHVPFLMVTNDATLSAMAAELQRLGRLATIWTSHPDAAGLTLGTAVEGEEEEKPARRSRGGRSRGGRGRSRGGSGRARGGRAARSDSRSESRAESRAAAEPPPPPAPDVPRKEGGKTLSEAAWTYASRLQRIKDVPSRVKTLLNDIKNRAGSHGFTPEEILEELKRHHGVRVDGQGRVQVDKVKPAAEAVAENQEEPTP